MNKIILSSMIFLLSTFTLFSDWEPFQLGRTNYYKLPDHYTIKSTEIFRPKSFSSIVEVLFDSVALNKKIGKNQYFNKRLKSIDSKVYKCDLSYYSLLKLVTNQFSIKNDLMIGSTDTYLYQNDTMFFFNNLLGNIDDKLVGFFIPLNLTNPHDTVYNNGYIISFINLLYDYVLPGIKDSIKVFYIEKETTKGKYCFKLSKKFGFIEFKNLDLILSNFGIDNNYMLKLVGSKLDSECLGFVPNTSISESFFNLKLGDKKYWFTIAVPFIGSTNLVYKISTINYINYSDSVLDVTYINKYYGTPDNILFVDLLHSDYSTESYDLKMIDIYKHNPNFNKFITDKSKANSGFDVTLRLLYGSGRTYFSDSSLNSSSGALLFDDFGSELYNCSVMANLLDYPTESFIYSPIVGLCYTFIDLGFWGDRKYSCILGYKKDGVNYGEIPGGLLEAEVSVNEISGFSLSISPNPVAEKLTLINIPDNATEFEIYDQFGNRQISGLISGQIDVSLLPAGVYFLKLNNSQRPLKFLKI